MEHLVSTMYLQPSCFDHMIKITISSKSDHMINIPGVDA